MTRLRDDLLQTRLRRSLPSPQVRRHVRELAGVSQRAVADELGVTRGTVSRWEAGVRTPSGPLLREYLCILRKLTAEHHPIRDDEDPAVGPGLVEKPARRGRHDKQ